MALTDQLSESVNIDGILSGTASGLTYFLIIALSLLVVGTILWYISFRLRFNKTIVIFEKISGQFIPTKNDKAMLVKIGDGGEELLYLRRHKIYRPAYGAKIGKNKYAYGLRSDGYWHNIVFGDLDEALSKLNVRPIDKDMRYANSSLRKGLRDRFRKQGFLEKYGAFLVLGSYIGLIAITGTFVFLIMDKGLELVSSVNGVVTAAEEVVKAAEQTLSALNNIQSNSGLQST